MTDGSVRDLFVTEQTTVRDVMRRINATFKSIALVVDESDCLVATITDGDVRRAILDNVTLDTTAGEMLRLRGDQRAVTAPDGAEPTAILPMMQKHGIRHVPLVDGIGRVRGLAMLDDLIPDSAVPREAVIMAGGAGSRLRPLTDDIPKPMLPVGGRPLMELTVERLRLAGIQRVSVATHYKPDKIVDHFGTGEDFGVEFEYVTESTPMGTAGALGLMTRPRETMLVINGDILTEIHFAAMLAFHREHHAVLTVAVRKFEMNVPYGVVEADGHQVRTLVEKPVIRLFTNAGIYLLEPEAYDYIPAGESSDMTDLIRALLAGGHTVVSFPVLEYWLDIGQHLDYLQAQEDVKHFGDSMKVGV